MAEYALFKNLQDIEYFVEEALEICCEFHPFRLEFAHLLNSKDSENIDALCRDLHILQRKIDIINKKLYHEDEEDIEEKINDTIEEYQIYLETFDKVRTIISNLKAEIEAK